MENKGGYSLKDDELRKLIKLLWDVKDLCCADAEYESVAACRDLANKLESVQLVRLGHSILLDIEKDIT
jgi:hypothetical protein